VVVEAAGEGTDTVETTANFVLAVNVENLVLATGAGAARPSPKVIGSCWSGQRPTAIRPFSTDPTTWYSIVNPTAIWLSARASTAVSVRRSPA